LEFDSQLTHNLHADVPPALSTPGIDATIGRSEPGVTTTRSPTFTVSDAITRRLGDVTGHAEHRRVIGTDEA
jgi:hypothetical protein